MSHKEYCAKLHEDQLLYLIETAHKRMEELKSEGYIDVWVVADYCNRAWYPSDQKSKAVEKMLELVQAYDVRMGDLAFSVYKDRMRPSEAAELFKRGSP